MNIQDQKEVVKYISETLDSKMKMVIETQLNRWYDGNIKQQVNEAIKEAFKKIMLVKFG